MPHTDSAASLASVRWSSRLPVILRIGMVWGGRMTDPIDAVYFEAEKAPLGRIDRW